MRFSCGMGPSRSQSRARVRAHRAASRSSYAPRPLAGSAARPIRTAAHRVVTNRGVAHRDVRPATTAADWAADIYASSRAGPHGAAARPRQIRRGPGPPPLGEGRGGRALSAEPRGKARHGCYPSLPRNRTLGLGGRAGRSPGNGPAPAAYAHHPGGEVGEGTEQKGKEADDAGDFDPYEVFWTLSHNLVESNWLRVRRLALRVERWALNVLRRTWKGSAPTRNHAYTKSRPHAPAPTLSTPALPHRDDRNGPERGRYRVVPLSPSTSSVFSRPDAHDSSPERQGTLR